MKLQQLRFILAIKECGLNITQASQRLYTSQPGVSKQLRLLEEELGIEIFSRNGKALVGVTEAGNVVLDKAQKIMDTVDDIKLFSKESSDNNQHVSIAQYMNCA
ncbi:LysR family transcriptional regulator [Aliikangiella sp. G2MR2-5]|uniref:LysR family transcriptional regulator n=1 Tax=Aliikangiella sp. G2MR2-5 TaxID=2788943 RepID=UPI0018AA94A9|nr:LysR family transcriptional regulator [Aliikangiella sp. G2MR2-5]